ncbi:hypothetical protein LSH36_1017g00003 [Paralvinella palmiformis]|uniref:Uncharacterized protein n=1 Tax=Paralvinella palmiformis TaxID=53620 RepID=A0AAD9IWJ1_9ANNE|nr:hypothetical protein LSH36_1017g00003 [Paralvinella palmiformis]
MPSLSTTIGTDSWLQPSTRKWSTYPYHHQNLEFDMNMASIHSNFFLAYINVTHSSLPHRAIPLALVPKDGMWTRCVQRTADSKAIITTDLYLHDPKLVTSHNHIPYESNVVAAKRQSRMKLQGKRSFDKPSQMMSQVSSEADVSARVHTGREESVKRTLRNQILGRIPGEPDSLQDLIIDDELAQTSGSNPKRV